jgi:thioredoxin 1
MEITSAELKEKIKNGDKLMVDFFAEWCGPCKVMKPMFESASQTLKDQNSDIQLYTFDIESDTGFVSELGIRSVPMIKAFSNGKEVFSEVGLKQKSAIMEMVQRLN